MSVPARARVGVENRIPVAMRAQSTNSPLHASTSNRNRARRGLLLLSTCGVAVLAACGGGGGGGGNSTTTVGGTTLSPGDGPVFPSSAGGVGIGVASAFAYPESFSPSPAGFFVDANDSGESTAPRLVRMEWGRLADVFAIDPVTGGERLLHRDYLIGEDIRTDNSDYVLATNAVTEQTTLSILHEIGTPEFQDAFDRLDDNLGPIQPKSLAVNELPPFSFVPRNAAVRLVFSDLLSHNSVSSQSILIGAGNPPDLPFEARIVPDPNYGGLVDAAGGREFRTSRVLIDTTVSALEALEGSAQINSLGFPAAPTTAAANVGVRLPTKAVPGIGQLFVLTNHTGHTLTTSNNGPVDFASPSLDIVRAMRSGGETAITGDENNGFLLDLNEPRLLGAQPVSVSSVAVDPVLGDGHFRCDIRFDSVLCSFQPVPGDVLEQPGVFAEVIEPGAEPVGGLVPNVLVRLANLEGDPIQVGEGSLNSLFDEGDVPECFLLFTPPARLFPNAGVDPSAEVAVRFSEPMDPASLNAFDTMRVLRQNPPESLNDFVVATVEPTSNLREFRFVPLLPFEHEAGSDEEYFFALTGGESGVTDLAGNALAIDLPPISFRMDPLAASERNGSIVLTFADTDEDGNGSPEITGQLLYDIDRGLIRPRPVSRFTAVADRTQAVPSLMIPFGPGVQTPLSPLGSRLMFVWRYFDVGFSATDETNHNVDIEGIAWSPIGGNVIFDTYDEFEIALAHSNKLPDEVINPTSLLPTDPNSGLTGQAWDSNVLPDPLNALTVVHPREKGYVVSPADLFSATTGTTMLPFPLNTDGDVSNYQYWTWRDTRVLGVGGPQSNGFDAQILFQVGLAPETGGLATAGNIPSIGLPILMDIRCFPDDQALGLNSFDISLAINSSSRPNFRTFSTGGTNTSGAQVTVDPDLIEKPTGGFNPTSTPPGKTTPVADNSFYIGQLNIITRVSTVFTQWLNADDTPTPDYLDPVMEPSVEQQPQGTFITLDFRGAETVTTIGEASPQADASVLDFYGDLPDQSEGSTGDPNAKNQGISFFPQPFVRTWYGDIDEVDGADFIQVRMTFVSSQESLLTPELSALGIAFNKPF